jgi:hypothetical protein
LVAHPVPARVNTSAPVIVNIDFISIPLLEPFSSDYGTHTGTCLRAVEVPEGEIPFKTFSLPLVSQVYGV